MSVRYIHLVSVKKVPQFAFTSRWGASAWANRCREDNGFEKKDVEIRRLRIVGTTEELPTTGCMLL